AGLRAARELGPEDVRVIVLPVSGRGYLAKIFNDPWMEERGFDYDVRETVLPAWGRGGALWAGPGRDDDGATGAAGGA
ncbi:cystathionine beta-synthase, partial [Micrococcus sp. SIMBA_131]